MRIDMKPLIFLCVLLLALPVHADTSGIFLGGVADGLQSRRDADRRDRDIERRLEEQDRLLKKLVRRIVTGKHKEI